MLQAKPGAFARLGQGGAEGGCFLHNSTYDFNDDVIPLGAGLSRGARRKGDAARRRRDRRDGPHGSRRISRRPTRGARALPCGRRGARAAVESHVLPELRGIAGRGARDGRRAGRRRRAPGLLVLWSATHGVEGYCGSGCQTGFLHDDAFMRAVDDAAAPPCCSCMRSIRTASRTAAASTKTTPTSTATSAISRRRRRSTPATRRCIALLLPAAWPPPPENEARLGAWIATHGERALPGGLSRRSI